MTDNCIHPNKSGFLALTDSKDNSMILVNSVRNDFIKKDVEGRAVFINKDQPNLTVNESFERVAYMLGLNY